MKNILIILPPHIRDMMMKIPTKLQDRITEIRLRVNSPIFIYCDNREWSICTNGLTAFNGYVFNLLDAEYFWRNICDYSSYTLLESQRQGFVTIEGGHRIGLCGDIALENGSIKHIKKITSFCIRIAHQALGCAVRLAEYLTENSQVLTTIIVSPPGCGKTTILRDLARIFSDSGYAVCIADERNEIAACKEGIPILNVGKRTDVYAGCPKNIAMNNMLRSLKPSIIITDELGSLEDAIAVIDSAKGGVTVIASVHGSDYGDVATKQNFTGLFKENIIKRVVVLSDRNGPGTIEDILTGSGKSIMKSGERICC